MPTSVGHDAYAVPAILSIRILPRQSLCDPHSFEADFDHLPDEADDVLRGVGAVRVGADAATLVLGNLILIDDPVLVFWLDVGVERVDRIG